MEQINPTKVVLVGSQSVGKTSIISAAAGSEFSLQQTPTIGACFSMKKYIFDERVVRLHIWDTAGQERFRSLTPSYYRDAEYVVIVYAINDLASFQDVDTWHRSIIDECTNLRGVVLVGNKCDLVDEACLKAADGTKKQTELNIARFYETSAKDTSDTICMIFEEIAHDVLARVESERAADEDRTVTVSDGKNGGGGKCC